MQNSKEYEQWLDDRDEAQRNMDNRTQLEKDLDEADVKFFIQMILLIPASVGLITIIFLLLIVFPYFIRSGLYEYNVTNWIEENTEFVSIEYVDSIGDGNWAPSYFLYDLNEERTAYNCWNKKSGGWRAINCKESSLQEYEIMNRR